jgi:mRNA interferase YafQ
MTWKLKRLSRTSQFKQDAKRQQKRGKDVGKLKSVIEHLAAGEELDAHLHDHALIGQYVGTRECHIDPDWLLIYEATADEVILIRTGSHSDLFKR